MTVSSYAEQINKEISQLKTRRAGEEVICPICQCEMFDAVDFTDVTSVNAASVKQQGGQIAADYVVMMNRCKDHYFHLECLEA